MEIRIPKHDWIQVGGDMSPGAHGGVIARADGNAIEIIEIQPVRAYVGDGEAIEVGFPFWSKEGYYDAEDLSPDRKDVQDAMRSWGFDMKQLQDIEPDHRAVVLAEMLLQYGAGADEGPSGWSEDVVPGPVKWWGSEKPIGAEYIADEDDEFRDLLVDNLLENADIRDYQMEGNNTLFIDKDDIIDEEDSDIVDRVEEILEEADMYVETKEDDDGFYIVYG